MTLEDEYKERVRVLAEMDTAKFVEMQNDVGKNAIANLSESQRDHAVQVAMHRARYELLEMPQELREESRAWLQQRHIRRQGGKPWPAPTSIL